jgi:hypothetical protein
MKKTENFKTPTAALSPVGGFLQTLTQYKFPNNKNKTMKFKLFILFLIIGAEKLIKISF